MSARQSCGTAFMPVMKCIWIMSWFMHLNKELLELCLWRFAAYDPVVVDSIFTARNLKRLSGSTDVAVAQSDTAALLVGSEKTVCV